MDMMLTKVLREHKGLSGDDLEQLEILEYAAKNAARSKNRNTFEALSRSTLKLLMGDDYTDNQYNVITSNTKAQHQYPFDSVNLSRRGIIPFRVMYSHYAHEIRGPIRAYEMHNGIIKDEDKIKALVTEMNQFPVSVHKLENKNIIRQLDDKKYPVLRNVLYKSGLTEKVMKFMNRNSEDWDIAKQLYFANTFVQRVNNKPDDGDEQKDLHSDIFFPAVKFWYFPEAVAHYDGPFEYVPKSTKINFSLLEYWYLESIKVAQGNYDKSHGRGHAEGSIRLKVKDIIRVGEGEWEIVKMAVPADTLIIGNVFGFHRRGNTTKEHTRMAVHGSIRVPNPFQ